MVVSNVFYVHSYHPLPGEAFQIGLILFQLGLNHQIAEVWSFFFLMRSFGGSNHLLRMVMEPKYYAEEVIGHPNHHLGDMTGFLGSCLPTHFSLQNIEVCHVVGLSGKFVGTERKCHPDQII